MLQITIPATELWDDVNQVFITSKEHKLQLEHSLVSISKWESKWKVPFLAKGDKTYEQTVDYIRCMTITQNIDPSVYKFLTVENMEEVKRYMDDTMTATHVNHMPSKGRRNNEQLTSELIYYQMTALNIPFECQKWHLNRLLKLIEVCNVKSQPPRKMSNQEILAQQAAINAERKKRYKTKG